MSVALCKTKQATGGFKELLLLFFPLVAVSFSNCLFLLVEKLFLAHLSKIDFEAAVNAVYAWQIFQGSCLALAMTAQVYVGRWWGANDEKSIGPGIWQFIWFSFFSILITVPMGCLFGYFYFKGTEIEGVVLPYYYFLLVINFLFPLAVCLASFYIGQGKTRLVLWSTLAAQVTKIGLAYILILGWSSWIPSMGLMGGAISTLIAQGGLCVVLFAVFLNSKHALVYDTRNWHFKPRLFWNCIYPGLSRASCRMLTFLSWAAIAHLMSVKGGDYLLFVSIGGSLFLFVSFLSDALCQAQTTIASQILGAGQYDLLRRAFRSGLILVLITTGITAIPFLVFPTVTFSYLFTGMHLDEATIRKVFFGVWLSFAFFNYVFLPISHVLAFKDAKFFFFMGVMNWFNGFLLMYVAIVKFNIAADQFWLVLSLMHATTALLYYCRMRWLESRVVFAYPPCCDS